MASGPPRDDVGEDQLRVTAPKRWAAGMPGVIASVRVLRAQTTAPKAVRTMLRINQPDGFDCPGCAWPEPHDTVPSRVLRERRQGRRRGGHRPPGHRRLLRRPRVAELAERTDYWLGQQGRLTEPVYRPPGDDALPADLLGRGRSQLIGGRLRALASPDRAVFYTSGRTSNEAAFLYQLFVRAFGTNNLPDCSNMCHESSGVALGRDDRHRQGHGHPRRLPRRRADPRRRPEPGHQPPAHAQRPRAGQAQRRRDRRRSTRCPRPGCSRFRNPQRRPRPRRARHGARRPPPADRRRRRPRPVPVGQPAAASQRRRRRPSVRRRPLRRLRRARRPPRRARSRRAARRHRSRRRRGGRVRRPRRQRPTRIIACWAMGLTQHRQAVATIQEIVNTLLLRGSIGQPRRRAVPGARPQQRAGRPHDGHLRTPPEALLDALAGAFGVRPAAAPRLRHGRRDRGDGRRRRRRVRRPRRQLRRGGARHRRDRGGAGAVRADRAGLDEAQPLARPLRRGGADPAVPRPHRGRSREAAVRHRRGLDGHRPRHARQQRAGVAAPAQRGRHRLRRSPRPRSGDRPIDWAALRRRLRRRSATTSRRRSRASTSSTRASRHPGGFALPNPPRDSRTFPTATGTARLTVNQFEPIAVPPGRLLLQTVRSHDQFNTTIYGLDDRYRGVHGGRRVVFVQPRRPRRARPRRRRPRRHRQRVARRPRAPGQPRSGSSPTRPPAAAAPPTSPRPTCSSRSTASPRAAARRRRRRSSCASSPPPSGRPANWAACAPIPDLGGSQRARRRCGRPERGGEGIL